MIFVSLFLEDWLCIFVLYSLYVSYLFVFFKQKTAYEMRISDWSSDVCSSDLQDRPEVQTLKRAIEGVFEVAMRLINIVIRLAPLAVFCFMFNLAALFGDRKSVV